MVNMRFADNMFLPAGMDFNKILEESSILPGQFFEAGWANIQGERALLCAVLLDGINNYLLSLYPGFRFFHPNKKRKMEEDVEWIEEGDLGLGPFKFNNLCEHLSGDDLFVDPDVVRDRLKSAKAKTEGYKKHFVFSKNFVATETVCKAIESYQANHFFNLLPSERTFMDKVFVYALNTYARPRPGFIKIGEFLNFRRNIIKVLHDGFFIAYLQMENQKKMFKFIDNFKIIFKETALQYA